MKSPNAGKDSGDPRGPAIKLIPSKLRSYTLRLEL